MKRITILVLLWSSSLIGQQNFEAFNKMSFSSNYVRPLTGIVDVNIQIPTTPSQWCTPLFMVLHLQPFKLI